jgi:hypothetical protein
VGVPPSLWEKQPSYDTKKNDTGRFLWERNAAPVGMTRGVSGHDPGKSWDKLFRAATEERGKKNRSEKPACSGLLPTHLQAVSSRYSRA